MKDAAIAVSDTQSKAAAGAAGAGGGTLLVVLATSLPADSQLRPWLLWAAPSVSVFLSAIWLWAQVRLANYLRDREVAALVQGARTTLEQALGNSNTSVEHKERIRTKLEELEQITVERQMDRIRKLRVLTAEDLAAAEKSVREAPV